MFWRYQLLYIVVSSSCQWTKSNVKFEIQPIFSNFGFQIQNFTSKFELCSCFGLPFEHSKQFPLSDNPSLSLFITMLGNLDRVHPFRFQFPLCIIRNQCSLDHLSNNYQRIIAEPCSLLEHILQEIYIFKPHRF